MNIIQRLKSLRKDVSIIRELSEQNAALIKKQQDQIKKLNTFIEKELNRRDEWQKRISEANRTAAGRPVWIIKCPAPDSNIKLRWGEYAYANSLKKYLEKLGCYVLIDLRQNWNCPGEADVVLVLRGPRLYRPDRRDKKAVYIMWNISHPDQISHEEYELYDIVCVASEYYAEILKKQVSVPVYPLLQCTDTALFHPDEEETVQPPRFQYLFVGNSKGVVRNCVLWAVEDELPLTIYGGGWSSYIPDHMELVEGTFIENNKLPELYRHSKATINDHWEAMLKYQFVNNRIFDSLACGLPVISDYSEELYHLFPEAVLYYRSHDDFRQCVKRVEDDYASIKEQVSKVWPIIRDKYSFEIRCNELLHIVEKHKNGR